ncbi:hypothetical protein GCM10027160_15510 [Streptomyces calidiresistens]|uniref:DUF6895 domain-containing protein n=1 Tax=Streptomyces calidiresistens TaxID=1485586 RepID=A0A7W3XWJ1_9ACTN|nr:hypothetical protein [Streptomyces calidiresistens]MBB0229777.1 hypothetical protein [Streptomyces calidiresistens]
MRSYLPDRLALEALEWTQRNLSRFELPDDITDPDTDPNWTMKPVGELAQLSSSILGVSEPGGGVHRLAGELLDFCWRQVHEGMTLLRIFREEPAATYPLEIYAAFAGAGLRHPGFEEFASSVCATRSWRLAEQDPNRRLGVLDAERRSGLTPHGDFEPALRRTWLGGLPEPWTMDRGSGYHLTHTVFHITRWGRAPHRMPGDLEAYLGAWLPCWLDTCVEAAQWDLTCELLAVGASLPGPPDVEHLAPAWESIGRARRSDGSLPEEGTGPADDDPGTTFAYSYHSTLAAAFAAALTASRLRTAASPRSASGDGPPGPSPVTIHGDPNGRGR